MARVARIRAVAACVAGCAAVGLALGAAPASAQADPDVDVSIEEKFFEAFMQELASELDANGRLQELVRVLSDAEEEGQFAAEHERDIRDDVGSRAWTVDVPMGGAAFLDVLVDVDELPVGWELNPRLLEDAYLDATADELEDLRITSEGLVVTGPGNDGSLTKNFTLDGLGVSEPCLDAVEAFDAIDEDVDHMVVLPLGVQGSDAYMFLASTPQEQDLFTGYYDAIVRECGTSIGEESLLHVGIEPYKDLDGFAVNMTMVGDSEEVHMGGASLGHNHVFFVGEGEMDSGEVQEVLSAQIDALEQAVN